MQEFEGKLFKIQQGYLCRGKRKLHRLIWEKFNGPIPKGHHIHHKDGDKLNNSIHNLECLSHAEHLSLHMKERGDRLYAWHKSEEGRKALGTKASKLMAKRPFKTFNCPQCKKDFQSQNEHRVKYCGINCQQAARRARGDDVIERSCIVCSKPFKINKYHKTLTCGYSCGSKYRTRFAKGKRHAKKSNP